ncbi:hypothetical protein ACMGDK_19685 [Chryseobacterium sp. DT-3]|uniref:hypothetical protein n=1 Tax=Chryseobacterium sp. DT-3 TaxID=3396164 RepID=UPI003F1A6153
MKNTKKYLLIILISLLCLSCNKIFPENMESFMFQLKDSIYLNQPSRSILVMHKIREDSFIHGKVIVNDIDSVYINNNKSVIYIINSKNECIWVRSDFKTEKLNKKPKVNFVSITGYHD